MEQSARGKPTTQQVATAYMGGSASGQQSTGAPTNPTQTYMSVVAYQGTIQQQAQPSQQVPTQTHPSQQHASSGYQGHVHEAKQEIRRIDSQVLALKKRLESMHGGYHQVEDALFPRWATGSNACPDNWSRSRFNPDEQRLYCEPPDDLATHGPFNPACGFTAKFPERYDRCGWSVHCKAPWAKFGCYDASKDPDAKQRHVGQPLSLG